ncbi:hypothetical protein EYF80_050028 [Liparis tanakae]|uniref:Uncharacterized protein n=1 Tax=Liparis tanakae TaxID=230148 RepID=A0A4Z2FGD2_9TELE|nr:hypothetical protein EYF80_050028 [Liparis tanakae]
MRVGVTSPYKARFSEPRCCTTLTTGTGLLPQGPDRRGAAHGPTGLGESEITQCERAASQTTFVRSNGESESRRDGAANPRCCSSLKKWLFCSEFLALRDQTCARERVEPADDGDRGSQAKACPADSSLGTRAARPAHLSAWLGAVPIPLICLIFSCVGLCCQKTKERKEGGRGGWKLEDVEETKKSVTPSRGLHRAWRVFEENIHTPLMGSSPYTLSTCRPEETSLPTGPRKNLEKIQ